MLVVWGGRDCIFPVDYAREVARRFPKITVEVFSDVGHWPHMEAPERFNVLVVGFLGAGQ